MKDSLELKNAMKDEDDSENQMPNNLTQAIQALFDFMDREIEIPSIAKRATLEAYQAQIKSFLHPEKLFNGRVANMRRGKTSRAQKRVVVNNVDTDSDGDL